MGETSCELRFSFLQTPKILVLPQQQPYSILHPSMRVPASSSSTPNCNSLCACQEAAAVAQMLWGWCQGRHLLSVRKADCLLSCCCTRSVPYLPLEHRCRSTDRLGAGTQSSPLALGCCRRKEVVTRVACILFYC